MVSTTQTLIFYLSQTKSEEFIGHIQKHFITVPHINDIEDFVKCCIKRWLHLNVRPDNMLFGRLQPIISNVWSVV